MLFLQKEDFALPQDDIAIHIDSKRIIEPHSHNFLEFAYVTKGSATSVIGGVEATISKGDYFIVDYGTEHIYKSSEPFEIVNVLFLPRLIDKSLAYCKSFSTFLNHYLIRIDETALTSNLSNNIFSDCDGEIHRRIALLCEEYAQKNLGFIEIMRSVLIEILVLTMRKITGGPKDNTLSGFVRAAVAEQYAQPPTLEEIATKFGYSVPYVSAKLKATLGVGYREYVARVRMDEARRLLANTDKKIADVAKSVGYADVNFFYNFFKSREGISPAAFRRQITH